MKYKCSKCGFIHEGEIEDGYYCPLCYSTKFDFVLIEETKKQFKRVYVDPKSTTHARIEEKCINCGACSNTCLNIVNIKYEDKDNPVCIGCGQCILTCPTGALVPKYDYNEVLSLINDKNKIVIGILAPAVKVSLGDAFDLKPGTFIEGKAIASLKELGFDYIFDVGFGADLATVEETSELIDRINNGGVLPMFTSCCPSWVRYAEIYHKDLTKNLSTCKTPIGMTSTVIKRIFAKEEDIDAGKLVIVAITPCTSKKEEIIDADCDYVITTSELALAIRENNIDFKNLKDKSYDSLIGSSSGTLYGSSGGVMLSVIRTYYHQKTGNKLPPNLLLTKDNGFFKEYSIKIGKEIIKTASVQTMANLEKFLPLKESYLFVEVMNCNMGCIGGGGQVVMPVSKTKEILTSRTNGLKSNDKNSKQKFAYENPEVLNLYENHLEAPCSKKSKEYLHKKNTKL